MTLIEAAIIVGVVSILTAAMAPSVRGYVQAAQQAEAQQDTGMMASALLRFLTDVGETWVLDSGLEMSGGSTSHVTPNHSTVKRVDLLVSEGKIPVIEVERSTAGTQWRDVVDGDAIQLFDWFLVRNTPGNDDPFDAFRTGATMNGVGNFDPDSGSQYNAPHAWRGPYLAGPISADPWGNRYAANVEFLARTPNTTGSGSVNDVFVLSAGSNGVIETRFDTDGVHSPGDILTVLAVGTR